LNSNVEDGEKVYLRKAVSIIVEHDGKKDTIQTAEADIQSMLLVENKSIAKVNPYDKITPAVTSTIESNMDIKITRVDSTIQSVTENIDYATQVKTDDNMERGQEKVIQEGQSGEKVITTKISYEDKKEVDRSVTEEVVRQPVTKVLAQGTLGVLQLASRGDSKTYYKSTISVKATAYSANYSSTGKMPGDSFYGITSSGTTATRNTNGFSTIAVDPSTIPIGTKLYVEGYGFATAEDTGGAIIGKRIDVFFNDDSEAQNWGVRWVNVYILK
jgi:3D (Asp-Asp-Asp) domain-containing protein